MTKKKTTKKVFQSTLWDAFGNVSNRARSVEYLRSGMQFVPAEMRLGQTLALEATYNFGSRRQWLDDEDEILVITPADSNQRDVLVSAKGAIAKVMGFLNSTTAFHVEHEKGFDVVTLDLDALCLMKWSREDKKYAPWVLKIEEAPQV